jgi:hypothetical protein
VKRVFLLRITPRLAITLKLWKINRPGKLPQQLTAWVTYTKLARARRKIRRAVIELQFLWHHFRGVLQAASFERFESACSTHPMEASILQLDRIFHSKGIQARVVMIVRDSLWSEAPEVEVGRMRRLVRTVMTEAGTLDVPLEVDFD